MVILGPLVTLFAFSSCLGTILSGYIFACVTDIVYFFLGGIVFVAGVITAIIGVVLPDPTPAPSSFSAVGPGGGQSEAQVVCKKCGRTYDSSLFFCPACGSRQG